MAEQSDDGKGSTAQSRKAHNLKVALHFARNGIPVMPLREKQPLAVLFYKVDREITPTERAMALKDWRAQKPGRDNREPFTFGSSRDESTIRRWWRSTTYELSAGLCPGLVGGIVVDTDNKAGNNPDAALLRICLAEHGLDLDLTRYPIILSGRNEGRHIWMSNPESLGNNKAESIGADFKGAHGLVVAPGCLLPPTKDGDGTDRHYRAMPGSLDLIEALRSSTLPEMPACVRVLHTGGSGGTSLNDADSDVMAAITALREGPSSEKVERDVPAMIQQACDAQPKFAQLWRDGDDDGSAGRFGVARALLAEYGSNGIDVHDLAEVLNLWDHAIKGQDFGDREVARIYVKAAREAGVRSTGESLGNVEDQEGSSSVPQDRWAVARQAYADLRTAWALDHGLAEAGARLLSVVPGDAIPSTVERIESLLYRVQNGRPLPDTLDEAVARPSKVQTPPTLVYETRANIRQRSRAPTRWLVEGLIEQGVLFVLHGGYGTGKSLVISDLIYSVAYGLPWAGRKTVPAGVLYVCNEGPAGIARRQDAWHQRQAALGLNVEDGPIELRRVHTDLFTNEAHLNEISEQVRTFTVRHRIECGLVVLDTLRQMLAGGDENSAKDISAITSKLNRLRDLHGVTVGFLHHSGKDETRGASGSTAIVANVDVELIAKGKDGSGTITPGKMRDEANRAPIPYRIEAHDAGRNTDGMMERAGVAVMLPRAARPASDGSALGAVDVEDQAEAAALPEPVDATPILPDLEMQARRALLLDVVRALADEAPDGKVRSTDIVDKFNARRRMGRKDGLSRAALQIIIADLIEAGSLCRSGVGPKSRISLPVDAAGIG